MLCRSSVAMPADEKSADKSLDATKALHFVVNESIAGAAGRGAGNGGATAGNSCIATETILLILLLNYLLLRVSSLPFG